MKHIFKAIFKKRGKKDDKKNDFSAFFRDASAADQKKVLMKVIKKANEDQRRVVEKYEKMSKAA